MKPVWSTYNFWRILKSIMDIFINFLYFIHLYKFLYTTTEENHHHQIHVTFCVFYIYIFPVIKNGSGEYDFLIDTFLFTSHPISKLIWQHSIYAFVLTVYWSNIYAPVINVCSLYLIANRNI